MICPYQGTYEVSGSRYLSSAPVGKPGVLASQDRRLVASRYSLLACSPVTTKQYQPVKVRRADTFRLEGGARLGAER